MSEQKKRVIVDGVEFGDLFQFPRILGAVTSSLQLPRLVIALFMVMALVIGGKTWDQLVGGSVPVTGLTQEVTEAERIRNEALFRDALLEFRPLYVPQSAGGNQQEDTWLPRTRDARQVLADIAAGYTSDRANLEDTTLIDEYDAMYQSYRRRINALLRGPYDAMADEVVNDFHRIVRSVVYLDAREVLTAMGDLVIELPRGLWRHARLFTVVYGLFALLVLAIGGGAISRMAAVQVAGQERMRIRNAADFAIGNWVKLFLAPMLPLVLLFTIGLVISAVGVIMNVPILDAIVGLGYGIFLVLGLLLTFLLLCYAVGFPMLIPAVACENCDAGDAMTRTFNYILVRPLHYLGYVLTGLAGLAIGFFVVSFFVVFTLKATGTLFGLFTSELAVTQTATDVGIFNLRQDPLIEGGFWEVLPARGIAFWQMFLISFVSAYVLSYLYSASTTIYLLMRRACDGQDVEEIWWPGLMPGTLAPMPRTNVEFAGSTIAESIEQHRGAADDDDAGSKDTSPAENADKTAAKKTTKKKAAKKKKSGQSTKKKTSKKSGGKKKT